MEQKEIKGANLTLLTATRLGRLRSNRDNALDLKGVTLKPQWVGSLARCSRLGKSLICHTGWMNHRPHVFVREAGMLLQNSPAFTDHQVSYPFMKAGSYSESSSQRDADSKQITPSHHFFGVQAMPLHQAIHRGGRKPGLRPPEYVIRVSHLRCYLKCSDFPSEHPGVLPSAVSRSDHVT